MSVRGAKATRYVGGPILRYGGKVRLAEHIVPRLPRGRMYVEPFFGAGGLFFAIPEGVYDVDAYEHELTSEDHDRLLAAALDAVRGGGRGSRSPATAATRMTGRSRGGGASSSRASSTARRTAGAAHGRRPSG